MMSSKHMCWWLGILHLIIAVGAIPAGVMMLLDPSGAMIGLSAEQLAGSPFGSFALPGLALLAVIGLGNLVGAWASFTRRPYAWVLALVLGLFLMAFEAIQYLAIGFSWLQAVYFMLGLLQALSGWIARKPAALPVGPTGA